jgi:hypothetical protein
MLRIDRHGCFKRLCAVLVLLASVCGAPAAAESAGAEPPVAYIAGLDELPLMRPLTENMDKRVMFDTPAGRIVEAYASGPVSISEVTVFYRTTLPQLGWRRGGAASDKALSYEREGEQLIIDFPAGEGRSVGGNGATLNVRFTVRPFGAAGGSSKNAP